MNYKVEVSGFFSKQLKRLVKKYPSLKKEMSQLIESLQTDPKQGEPLGKDCYKIRLAILSKGKGKSGGARVLHTSIFCAKQFTCCLYTINQNSKISLHQ